MAASIFVKYFCYWDHTHIFEFFGRIAQLVRALPSHGRGRWFEPFYAHIKDGF